MQTNGKQGGFVRISVLAASGLIMFSALLCQLNAADQPQPGPEHKKLEVWVGDWVYEGSGEATPYLAASGKYKGVLTFRMVLGGFFVEGHARDTSENGYFYEAKFLRGYDSKGKTYVEHAFMNDGHVITSPISVSGNVWTTMDTATDSKGKEYKIKGVVTMSADGKTLTEVSEYSADGGKTWKKAYEDTMTKVSK